jgi:hypothetical protein
VTLLSQVKNLNLKQSTANSSPARFPMAIRLKVHLLIASSFAIMRASQFSLPLSDSFVVAAFLGLASSEVNPLQGSCVPGAHFEDRGVVTRSSFIDS